MSNPQHTVEIETVKRVRDADGAICLECSQVFDIASSQYWPRRTAQLLHKSGTGHKTELFRIKYTGVK